jgi:hypothetical protein
MSGYLHNDNNGKTQPTVPKKAIDSKSAEEIESRQSLALERSLLLPWPKINAAPE